LFKALSEDFFFLFRKALSEDSDIKKKRTSKILFSEEGDQNCVFVLSSSELCRRLKHTSTTSYSRFCSISRIFDENESTEFAESSFLTEIQNRGSDNWSCNGFRGSFGLVHPAQKFDMYRKLNKRS